MKYMPVILLLLLFAFANCKKDNENTVVKTPSVNSDFRDSLQGYYVGTKNNYSWSMGTPPNEYDTTYAWSFTILKDTSDSSIIADGILFKLDSTGSCYEVYYPGPTIKSFEFSNDTAILFFRSGGLGGYNTTTITGVRQ